MGTFAVVTGATSGIGRELVWLAAADGWNLVAISRSAAVGQLKEEIERKTSVKVVVIREDLAETGAPERVHRAVAEAGLAVEMLLNCAGAQTFGRLTEVDWARQAAMLQLNMVALAHLTRLFLPSMLSARHGYILNVASTAAFKPSPYQSLYNASKSFVLSFSEGLHAELRDSGVVISCLCPGATDTPFFESAGLHIPPEQRQRFMSPAAVAQAGYRGLLRGDRLTIPGLRNQAQYVAARLLPHAVSEPIVRARATRQLGWRR
jgi:uncharacterized protein